MSKIFNNILPCSTEPTPSDGWFSTTPYDATRIKNISDTIGGGLAVTKMGTSIPTPFARLMLFNTAFAQIQGHNDQTVYGRLVSECLDMLEFVFNYGSDITVKQWNAGNEIAALNASSDAKHNTLGKSLAAFVQELGVQDIYLLYYQGQLVGGTSPYTVLYTSPNWTRRNNLNFQGTAGNILFPDYANRNVQATPLHKRDQRFREFLTDYIVAFRQVLGENQNALWNYVYENATTGVDHVMQAYYPTIAGADPINMVDFMLKYNMMNNNIGAGLDVKGLGGKQVMPVAYGKAPANAAGLAGNVVSTDYALVPTSYRWKNMQNGLTTEPLVLNQGGVTGALYIGGNAWNSNTPINNAPTRPLTQRVLPGAGNVTYPYVTADDFLEDMLIHVDYDLNNDAFRTFGLGHYLPPLKPLFFQFFDAADLEDSASNVKLSIGPTGQNDTEVTLRLPIHFANQSYIELKKTYDANHVKHAQGPMGFCLSVFPSYKVVNAPTVHNRYSVMRYEDKITPSLQLDYWAIGNTLQSLGQDPVHHQKRDNLGMSYDAVDSAFDLIQVRWDGAQAMLAPRFNEVTPQDRGASTLVGIDFGTTNSYVCFSVNNGANPEPLTFNESQTLPLGHTNISTFEQAAEREFAPALMGPGCKAYYPYRTVIYENPQTMANPRRPLHGFKLFADANVGFNFINESIDSLGGKYITTIKWDMENNNNPNNLTIMRNRVEAFCRQTAWMLKNRLMANASTATTKFTAKLTLPYTMRVMNRNNIVQAWKDAFDYVMGPGNVTVERLTESVAPYYYMVGHNVTMNDNVVNVDVGGGTTDILYADVKNKRLLYDSSHFAGDDIWGDGPRNVANQNPLPQERNGFMQLFEELRKNGNFSDEDTNAYVQFSKIANKSADRMAFIFSHDDKYNFTTQIANNHKLTAVLHLHLAALCCHIAQTMMKEGMELPVELHFSGQGAKYVKLISSDDKDITKLVALYIDTFLPEGKKLGNDFKVKFQQNSKEVTAQGALFEATPALNAINGYGQKDVVVSGLEGDEPKTYKDAAQPEVKQKAHEAYKRFAEQFLRNDKVRRHLRSNYEVEFTDKFISTFEYAFNNGYADAITKATQAGGAITDDLPESLFFWPFKKAIYECSKL